jgi:hypothetical protein
MEAHYTSLDCGEKSMLNVKKPILSLLVVATLCVAGGIYLFSSSQAKEQAALKREFVTHEWPM